MPEVPQKNSDSLTHYLQTDKHSSAIASVSYKKKQWLTALPWCAIYQNGSPVICKPCQQQRHQGLDDMSSPATCPANVSPNLGNEDTTDRLTASPSPE
jgi:hypothetical protein